jgi:sialic acid synthase SpsE
MIRRVMFDKRDFHHVFIISEIHPQFGGSMKVAQRMIMASKLAGADAVKVQLYDSQSLFGNRDREYLQIDKSELADLKEFCDSLGIELFASVFTPDRVAWCEELNFPYYKIASPTVADVNLCREIIRTGKPVFVSTGKWDWKTKGFPYEGENLIYFYCISKYPTPLDEIEMPVFGKGGFEGYSDHTVGIDACLFAVARGAIFLEKHMSLNKSLRFPTELGHTGSMDEGDLRNIRKYADSFSLLERTAEKELAR